MRATRPDPEHRHGHDEPCSPLHRANEILHREIHLHDILHAEIAMSHLGAAVAATAVVAGGLTAGARVRPDTSDPVHQEPEIVLVEEAGCDVPPTAGPPDGNVRVVVPPTALVHVDAAGRVIAAMTNTGCAPRPTDDVWVVAPSGDTRPADPALADRTWHGDFRIRGELVSQAVGD